MDISREALDITYRVWPTHCKLLGPAYVSHIDAAVRSGEPVEGLVQEFEGGDSFDLGTTVHTVYEGLQVASVILGLYLALRKELSRKPTSDELQQKATATSITATITSHVVCERLKLVIDEVIKAASNLESIL